jgi:peptidylprolyl isomerase
MRRLIIIPILALALGISACNDSKTGPTGPTPIEEEKFAPELKVDLSQMTRTASGLYYQDLVEGQGTRTVAVGDLVSVSYSGWLVNGKRFDTSEGKDPIEALIGSTGEKRVIEGWDEGLRGMKVGGTRKLVIPSHLAYGAQGTPRGEIPPHATLVFDVAVAGIK